VDEEVEEPQVKQFRLRFQIAAWRANHSSRR
jgi:hypothetical protein